MALTGLDLALDDQHGRLFVGASDENGQIGVATFDLQRGAWVRTTVLERANDQNPYYLLALAFDARTQRVFAVQEATDSVVSVLDAASGVVVHRTGFSGLEPVAVAVDARRGWVFVAHWDNVQVHNNTTGAGTVSVLDGITGRERATFGVGVAPVDVAVDAGTERVLVLNSGGPPDAYRGSISVIDISGLHV